MQFSSDLTKGLTVKTLTNKTARIAIALAAAGLAIAPSTAALADSNTVVSNDNSVYFMCDASSDSVVFAVTDPDVTTGDLIGFSFSSIDDRTNYSTTSITGFSHGPVVDGEIITLTFDEIIALAAQSGVTAWPIEFEVGSYPAGTTDFSIDNPNVGIWDYVSVGIQNNSLSDPTYPLCAQPTPAAPEALPNTGTDSTGMVVTGFAALALLTAGSVAVAVRRRRASL